MSNYNCHLASVSMALHILSFNISTQQAHWLAVEGVIKVSPAGSSSSQGLLLSLLYPILGFVFTVSQ